MSENRELDLLKSKEQRAFSKKQDTWQKYVEAKDRTRLAYYEMVSAWQKRCDARDKLNNEYAKMISFDKNSREIWEEYKRISDYNNSRIELLRLEADREHQEVISCFERASFEYEFGDRAMASVYSRDGHEHKERRNRLNTEVSMLTQEIRDAKNNAKRHVPRANSAAFHDAKIVFDRLKFAHESAQADFKYLKAIRDHLKTKFEHAQVEHARLREELRKKLEEVRADKNSAEEGTIDENTGE